MARTKNYDELLKAERKARKLSQEAMADLIGVSTISYSLWERGKYYPTEESIEKIREAIGLTLEVDE